MTARLPLCAWCGKTLARQAYITVRMTALPGRPKVGWHWAESGECASIDPDRDAFKVRGDGGALLAAVERRGARRVARVGWTTTDARCLKLGRGRKGPEVRS